MATGNALHAHSGPDDGPGERARPRAALGFTLIEALVVLGIGGLVAGLIFPALDRARDSWRFREAVTAVNAGLARARSDALRSGGPVAIRIAEDGRLALRAEQTIWRLPDEVRLADAPEAVAFFPDGSATATQLTIADRSRTAMIAVDGNTGRIGRER